MSLRRLSIQFLTTIAMVCHTQASPVGIATSPDGSRIYVAMEQPPAVMVMNGADGNTIATWQMPQIPNGISISSDGGKLFIPAGTAPGQLLTVDATNGSVILKSSAGHSPRHVTPTADGKSLFVCNTFENRVELMASSAEKPAQSLPVTREPVASALRPDGAILFVANMLPAGAANTGDISVELSVIETASGKTSAIRLPNGSTDAKALALSPDGKFLYIVHTLARYALPTTQLDRGWMNTSALSVIDATAPKHVTTVLLDEIDRGAANPSGVAVSNDGRLLAVTHAGTHEVSLIDRAAMHDRIDRAGRGESVTPVSRSHNDIPNDLSFLHGIRKRIKLNGNGPRSIATTPDGFAVGAYFSDTLHLVKTGTALDARVIDVTLVKDHKESPERVGERLFFDASLCFQQWQSCATCHPNVRTDGLNWDLLNDGIGNPKQTKSLLFSIHTPPVMISGIRPDAETAIRTGMRYIQFMVPEEEDAEAIEAFLRNLKPVPSPALVDGKLSPSAVRGREVFIQAACAKCHPGEYYADGRKHDIKNATGMDQGKAWDTPTLRELWRTAPYLHDGRAATLEDVVGSANPGDKHGVTSKLTDKQRADLVEFLRSL